MSLIVLKRHVVCLACFITKYVTQKYLYCLHTKLTICTLVTNRMFASSNCNWQL